MELSPQSVASTTFKTVKKGYDPDEVRAYLAQLSTAIESIQAQATAMEARARAAVARLQELAANPAPTTPSAAAVSVPHANVDESETISRTLLLAQRTADSTVAEAEAEAKRIRDEADTEARDTIDSARETQNRLIDDAKSEARRAGEGARIQIESEVQALLARREFLLSDVDHLEQHAITHRDRLREVAAELTAIVDRGPGGLADLRRPLMSAVTDDDDEIDATQPLAQIDSTNSRPVESDGVPSPDAANEATDDSSDDASDDANDDANDAVPEVVADDAGAMRNPDGDGGADSDHGTGDRTPAAGSGMLFRDVTSEVTIVPRPAPNAVTVRSDDER